MILITLETKKQRSIKKRNASIKGVEATIAIVISRQRGLFDFLILLSLN